MTGRHENDMLRLRHMRDYGREVSEFIKNANRNDLEIDVLLHHGLSYALGIIGEAATNISTEFRNVHPEIPWRHIVGMRNFLFHDYAGVNNDILWNTAVTEVPELLRLLDAVLTDEDTRFQP